ncbi:extracellular solute-binding protein [Paenibacillus sp. IITD108]|uniref:extracellular solute-binding protein n=1 Tax=Paenibacillus sp. IITD108 TaxID=3116649 RepID=UPI002F3FA215
MKLKKMSLWVSLIMVIVTVMSGCGKNNNAAEPPSLDGANTPGSSAAASEADPANPNQISKEKITIKALTATYPEAKLTDYNYDQNAFTKWLEDTTNIHIEWITVPSSADIQQKLSLLMSSGDIPDIMFQNNFPPSVQKLYGSQGLLLDMSDYIEQYGVYSKKMFEEFPDTKAAVTLDQGEIYALPTYADDPHLSSLYKMWINKPWLDNLGLEIPQTTDDLYQVLKAFKEQDPNGNKKNDEIPLLGNTAWVTWNPINFVMNSFVYYNPDRKLILNDGKVEPVFTKPEFREGLKYLQKLAMEGLLSRESFTMDFNQFKQAVENPDAPLVGMIPSHAPFVAADTRYPDYLALAPLKGPEGVQYANYHFTTNNSGVVVSAQTKYPVEVFKLLDFLYAPETMIRMKDGREGFEWEYAKEGEGLGKDGQPAMYKNLKNSANQYDPNAGEKNINWYMMANYFNPKSLQDQWLVEEDAPVDPAANLVPVTQELYVPYQPSKDMLLPQTIVFTEEESAEVSDIEIAINDYVTESMTRFILSSNDIDQQWDAYLKKLDQMGLERLISIYQGYMDRTTK